jgi:excisionase family DNA binding protein
MNILMTVEELAKYLKIKPDTIYKKVRKGELPAVKLGKLLRFPKELIDQWIVEQSLKTARAKKAITEKVEEVVVEVNKTAKVAQAAGKLLSDDVTEIYEDVKKASMAEKSQVIKKGLQTLWTDLSREINKLPRAGGKPKAKKTKAKSKKKPKSLKAAGVAKGRAVKKNAKEHASL